MSWNDFVYGLGDLIFNSFELLKAGGNSVNVFFIAIIAASLAGWVFMQVGYNKEAKQKGTYE